MSVTVARLSSLPVTRRGVSARWARSAIVLALLAGGVGGLMLGASAAPTGTEAELTQLLRAMAVLKLFFVAAATGAILWRLQAPVAGPMLAAYALTCAAMAAGPGMIWYLANLGPASLLLHGGVAMSALLLWREGVVSELLESVIARRRAEIRDRSTQP
ncbi:MAG: hypothetical protein ACRYF2_26210 [Janthinobacterium lividum]